MHGRFGRLALHQLRVFRAVALAIENTAHIEEKLVRNEFDLGFMGAEAVSRDRVPEPFLEDEIFFACSPGHQQAVESAVTPERLSRERQDHAGGRFGVACFSTLTVCNEIATGWLAMDLRQRACREPDPLNCPTPRQEGDAGARGSGSRGSIDRGDGSGRRKRGQIYFGKINLSPF